MFPSRVKTLEGVLSVLVTASLLFLVIAIGYYLAELDFGPSIVEPKSDLVEKLRSGELKSSRDELIAFIESGVQSDIANERFIQAHVRTVRSIWLLLVVCLVFQSVILWRATVSEKPQAGEDKGGT